MFDRADAEENYEVNADKVMEFVIDDASKSLQDTGFWDNLTGLQFYYWACIYLACAGTSLVEES